MNASNPDRVQWLQGSRGGGDQQAEMVRPQVKAPVAAQNNR